MSHPEPTREREFLHQRVLLRRMYLKQSVAPQTLPNSATSYFVLRYYLRNWRKSLYKPEISVQLVN